MNVKNINDLNKNKLTIVCSTNEKYLQYVKPFFNSLEKAFILDNISDEHFSLSNIIFL